MPRFDLRQNEGTLDPLAPFKVLAVMCYPADRTRYEEMMALLHSETGHGHQRRRGLTSVEFRREVKLHATRAADAASLLLTMLQLENEGYTPSLNRALPLVVAQLPKWDNYSAAYWSSESHFGHHPRSRRKVLAAFKNYRPVVHFWAAMIHGRQHERDDIWPGSLKTLPTFLAYANAILDLGCVLPSPARDRRFALTRSEASAFTIPEEIIQVVSLEALPFHDSQRRLLNEQEASNPLT